MNLHLLKLLIRTKTLSKTWAKKRYDHPQKNPQFTERDGGVWGKVKFLYYSPESQRLYNYLNPQFNLIINFTTGEVTEI